MLFAHRSSSSHSSSSSSTRQLCGLRSCNRPVHVDSQSGVAHDFCGRSHAREASAGVLADPHGHCHTCQLQGCNEPVFFEGDIDRVHDYCSRTHADLALRSGQRRASNRSQQGGFTGSLQCALPGCSAQRWIENGYTHDYCGRTHAKQAQSIGLLPPPAQLHGQVERVFRGRSGQESYQILQLNCSHPKYQGVKDQFVQSWSGGTAVPTVQRIYQVRNTESAYRAYSSHFQQVGNEVRRFHGTSMKCSFGIHQTEGPCSDPDCRVCRICEISFDITRAGGGRLTQNFGYLRYGPGLYFSKSPNKSHDYAADSKRHVAGVGNTRVMFLCRVALGRTLLTDAAAMDDTEVTNSRCTHDSVTGLTTSDGGQLNFEENVVYSSAAALPSYVIIYKEN